MGKPAPPAPAFTNNYSDMRNLYSQKQKEKEEAFVRQWGFDPNPAQLLIYAGGDADEMKAHVIAAMKVIGEDKEEDFRQFQYVINKCNRLLTPLNEDMWTEEEKQEWEAVCQEFIAQEEDVSS